MLRWFFDLLFVRWIVDSIKFYEYQRSVVKKYKYDPYRDGFGSGKNVWEEDAKAIAGDWKALDSYNPVGTSSTSSYKWCDDD